MKTSNDIGSVSKDCMFIVQFMFSFKSLIFILILSFVLQSQIKAQDIVIPDNDVPTLVFDEFPIIVSVEGFGEFNIDVIYTDNDLLFVDVQDLFYHLGIPCFASQRKDSLQGFLDNESRTYLIDLNSERIIVEDKIFNAQNRMVKEMGSIYLESTVFSKVFGIVLTFNYRSLSVVLKSNFELPIIKQQRLEKMRKNVLKLKGEETVDTILKRNYHVFKFGMIDWSIISAQTWNKTTDTHFGLGIGTELLYGEADISAEYSDRQKFNSHQLHYLWHWVDNDKSIIKQAQIGQISTQTISSVNSPVLGFIVRNSPTTVRKATGYYFINDFTEPNWTVELYINNIMVDYTKADASGLYVFKVPIVYGYSILTLKFYGTQGEERTEERTVNVPYTVMPTNEFEYGISAGIVQDGIYTRFGKGEFNYGINRTLTIGGGAEYLSSIPGSDFIPFAKATLQPFSKLTLNGEFAYGVKSESNLIYYFRRNSLLEIGFTKYTKGQRAVNFHALEERKLKVSIPFKFQKIVGFVKADYSQNVYQEFNFNQSNLTLSSYYKQFSVNVSFQMNWIDKFSSFSTCNFAMSYRLKKAFTMRPAMQYNVGENKLISCKLTVEKGFQKGNLAITFERNILYKTNVIGLSLKYELPYAETNIASVYSKNSSCISESARGSFAFGGGNNYICAEKNSSVGKGGILIYPFLDLNENGIFDDDEHLVKLTSVKILGGKVLFNQTDSIVRISNLNAFSEYKIEFDDNDLENIAWRFKDKIYQAVIDPNQFKRIDVPVIPVGEVSGTIYLNSNNTLNGIGRILVKIYKNRTKIVVAEILSESDGYFNYMGLSPGSYVACVDTVQLKNLGYSAQPVQKYFRVKTLEAGDIIEGIDFILSEKQNKDAIKE